MSPLDFWTVVIAGAFALSAPVIIAGVGEVVLERAGGFNVGIEGMMLLGAITGVLAARHASPWIGLAAGLAVGAAAGLAFAAATVWGGADVVIVGIAIGLLGAGLSVFLFQWLAPAGAAATTVPTLPPVRLGPLQNIPLLGGVLSAGGILFPISVALAVVTWLILRYTRFGLRLRAVGSDDAVARTRGLSPDAYRITAAVIGGAAAGLAGAGIPLTTIGTFSPNMTGGAGFIALAVVIIARQNPLVVIAGALLFAVFNSLALFAQTQKLGLPPEVYQALPYLVTIIVLSVVSRRLVVRSRRKQSRPDSTASPISPAEGVSA